MTNKRCLETGLSVSYAYKKGCRCPECKANKAIYTKRDTKAAERSKIWIANNKERNRSLKRKHADKKWLEKYEELRKTQESKCKICNKVTSLGTLSNSVKLHIDHCHKTGKLRGLLCGNCNVGLGHFKDNIQLLSNAIKYLEEHNNVYPSRD